MTVPPAFLAACQQVLSGRWPKHDWTVEIRERKIMDAERPAGNPHRDRQPRSVADQSCAVANIAGAGPDDHRVEKAA